MYKEGMNFRKAIEKTNVEKMEWKALNDKAILK